MATRRPPRSTKTFYDEYFAVLDIPAEFYLQTVDVVFQRFLLARGLLEWRGRRVDPAAIHRTALLTVEGERDDICGVGQTMAAQDLCRRFRPGGVCTMCSPASGTTGCSAAGRGSSRCARWCGTS